MPIEYSKKNANITHVGIIMIERSMFHLLQDDYVHIYTRMITSGLLIVNHQQC